MVPLAPSNRKQPARPGANRQGAPESLSPLQQSAAAAPGPFGTGDPADAPSSESSSKLQLVWKPRSCSLLAHVFDETDTPCCTNSLSAASSDGLSGTLASSSWQCAPTPARARRRMPGRACHSSTSCLRGLYTASSGSRSSSPRSDDKSSPKALCGGSPAAEVPWGGSPEARMLQGSKAAEEVPPRRGCGREAPDCCWASLAETSFVGTSSQPHCASRHP